MDAGDDLEEKDELIPEPVLSIKNQKFDLTATLGKLNTNSDEALSKLFELVNQLCDNSQFNEAFFVIQKMVRVDQFDFWSNSNLLVVDHFIAKLLQQVKQNTNPDYVLFALQALTEFLQPTQYKNTRQTARAFICRVDAQLFDVLIKTFKPTTDSTIAALSSLFEILLQPDSPSTHNDILDRELTIFSIHINTKIKKLKIDSLSKFSLGLGILGALSAGVALLLLFVFATTLFNPWILLFVSTPIMILGVAGFVGLKFWNSTTNVVDKNKSEEKLRTELQWAENNFSRISTMGPLIKTNLENWLHSYGIKSRRHSTLIKVLSQYSRLIDEINIERDKKAFEQCFGNFEMIEQLSDVIGPRKTIDILLQQSNAVFLEFLSSTSLQKIFSKAAVSKADFYNNRNDLYKFIRDNIVDKVFFDPQLSQKLFKTCDDLLLLLKNRINFSSDRKRDAVYDEITSKQIPCFKACIKNAEDFNKFLHFLEYGDHGSGAMFHVSSDKKREIKKAIWQTIQSDPAFGDRVLDAKQPEVQKFMQEFTASPSAASTSSSTPVVPSVYAQGDQGSSSVVPTSGTVVPGSTNSNNPKYS